LLPVQDLFAYHFPWDQGHDTTDYPDPDDDGPNCRNNRTRSPVFVCKGHFIWSDIDVALSGRPDLMISRTYQSHNYGDGIFGNGWMTVDVETLVRTVRKESDGVGSKVTLVEYILTDSFGYRYTYKLNDDGTVSTPAERFDTVVPQQIGGVRLIARDHSYKEFDSNGVLLSSVDRNGNAVYYEYGGDRLSRIRDDFGRYLDLAYDVQGRVAVISDHTNRSWQYGYDDDGNLISTTDPLGGVMQYEYQPYVPLGDSHTYYQITKITDQAGVVLAEVSYEGAKVATHKQGANTFRYTYNEVTNATTKTDSTNSRWEFVYNDQELVVRDTDPLGNVTESVFDENAQRISMKDPEGNIWTTTYDDYGRVVTDTTPLNYTTGYDYVSDTLWASEVDSPAGRVTELEHDSNGNVVSMTDPSGATSRMEWNDRGDTTAFSDALGNRTVLQYNDIGIVTQSTDPLGRITSYVVDDIGRVSEIMQPGGESETYQYDMLDRLTKSTNALGHTIEYRYDAAGRILARIDSRGYTTSYTFDEFGRQIRETRPDGAVTETRYRTDNLVDQLVDPRGVVTRYTYDSAKRVTRIDIGGESYSYQYDRRNLVVRMTGPDASIDYSYDADGRQTTESINGRANSLSLNPEGEVVRISAAGEELEYTYDDRGLLVSVRTPIGTHTYVRDGLGRVSSHTMPGGAVNNFDYDAAGQLSALDYSQTIGTRFDYIFDVNSRVSSITGGPDWTYQYDGADRLVSATGGGIGYSFSYDESGNRLEDNGDYDEFNKLIQDNNYNYSYDSSGKLTQKINKVTGEEKRFTYNDRGRLALYELASSEGAIALSQTIYEYDPLGRRVAKTVDGLRTEYHWYEDYLIAEYQAGIPVKRYRYGDSYVALEYVDSNGTYQVHKNHLDAPLALTDSTNQLVWESQLTPYGKSALVSDVDGDGVDIFFQQRFAGQYEDTETGMYYNRFRYYDPENGRYMTSDPIKFDGGDNLYLYANAAPTGWVDPYGLNPAAVGAAAVAAVRWCIKNPVKCRKNVCNGVNAVMHGICDTARSCKGNDSCSSLRVKKAQLQVCLGMRYAVSSCHGKKNDPNPSGHVRAKQQVRNRISKCNRFIGKACCGTS